MENPLPLRQHPDGLEAEAGALLELARQLPAHGERERQGGYRALAYRASRWRRRSSQRIAAGCVACALALTGLWAFQLGADRSTSGRGIAPVSSATRAGEIAAASTRAPSAFASAAAPGTAAWNRFDIDEIGTLDVSAQSGLELTDERQLRFEHGTLRAQIGRQDPARPLVIATPHLRVTVVGTRFDVLVLREVTIVSVLEGHVIVSTESASVPVSGGETIRSDEPRLGAPRARPPATPVAAAAPRLPRATRADPAPAARAAEPEPMRLVSDCAQLPEGAQPDCYSQLAAGDGLAAQNALLTLGLRARDVDGDPSSALEIWRRYERRFPDGVLGPEVALATLETELRMGRALAATETALYFERRYPDDPRAPDVALARAELLCRSADGHGGAMALLDRLAEHPLPRVRAAALELRAHCAGTDLDLGTRLHMEGILRSPAPPNE